MERNYKIYMHKNKINGKVYIGQTYQDLEKRFGCNGAGYKQCTAFYHAIQKYGWYNFDHILLEEGINTKEDANERERHYIKLYDSTDNSKGYNIQLGGYEHGNLCKPVYQYDMDGTYIRCHDSVSDAERAVGTSHISMCCNNDRNSAGGYRWSYDKVDNLGEYIVPARVYRYSKMVYQYSVDGNFIKEWKNINEALNYFGSNNYNGIALCCDGFISSSMGFQWRYEKYEKITPLKSRVTGKPIIQLSLNGDFINRYSNVSEAARMFDDYDNALNIIAANARHKCRSAYGYIWIREEEYDDFDINNYMKYKSMCRSVIQYDKDMNVIQRFISVRDAARSIGKPKGSGRISECANGIGHTAYGYIWRFDDEIQQAA